MHIYIHIPFCRQKCTYCKFALTPVYTDIQKRRYLAHLEHEIRTWKDTYTTEGIRTIYFWWWTPSILSHDEIRDILSLFGGEIEEITFEANPEDITYDYALGLKQLGITRMSLWVQTLNDTSLRTIQRSSRETILSAIEALERAGCININTDFILGLPHVAPWETLRDIQYLHTLFPISHTSVYMLEDELYPDDWGKNSIDVNSLRDEYISISDYFSSIEWNHYELSNWSQPWYESIHNRSYWNHSPYRWFWLSASSYIDRHRWTNSLSFQWYYRMEREESESLTPEQSHIERLMFWLRTSWIDRNFLDKTQIDTLLRWCETGEVKLQGDIFSLNSSWIFLIDHIMSELI